MKKRLIAYWWIMFLFYACHSGNEEKVPAFIEVSPGGPLIYEYAGGSDTLVVNSSAEWKITGETEWCYMALVPNTQPQQIVVNVKQADGTGGRSTSLVFSCGEKAVTVTVQQFGDTETGYADMGFDSPDVTVVYDKTTGKVTAGYTQSVPALPRAGKAIILPAKYNYEIRVIESARESGKQIILQTLPGNMCNLFRQVDFTLATDPSLGQGNVILPSEVGYLTQNGEYHRLEMTDKKAAEFFSFQKNFSDGELYNEEGNRLVWEKCLLEARLKGVFHFKFGEKEENTGKKGDLEEFGCAVEGLFHSDFLLNAEFRQEIRNQIDEIIQKNLVQQFVYRFEVGATPVIILTNIHLGKQLEIGAGASVSVNSGFSMNGNIKMGITWNKNGEINSVREYVPAFSLYPPVQEVKGNLDAKVSYYPVLEFEVYNFSGPWLKPLPYLKQHIESEAKKEPGDYYIWKSDIYAGLDLQMGLNFGFGLSGKEKWDSEHRQVMEEKIVEAPKKIELLASSDSIKVKENEVIKAKFRVKSYSPVTGQYELCPGAWVAFEAPNGLTQYFGMSDWQGEVTVEWKPENLEKEAVLTAGIVGKDQVYIDQVSLTALLKGEELPAQPVDLGLSVRWAGWNVGAASPEEYGDCFAWGETEEKTTYTWETYTFWKDLDHDGKITWDEVEDIGNIEGTPYDIAHARWGDTWRMPTSAEMDELLNKCTWEWTSYKGVSGRKVTGPNGNSIFLPATGQQDEKGLHLRGAQGFYWSGSLTTGYSNCSRADRLYFCQSYCRWQADYRCCGGFIRPVTP